MGCRYNFAKWWHLLSLDAPTVAALWSWLFARSMHLHMPLLTILLLAAATWLLYVADRILDGLCRGRIELRERHLFHARHRRAFVVCASILAVLLAWIFFTRMNSQALKDDLFLSVFALLYFFFIHAENRFGRVTARSNWLPKELVVGILFAAATAVPAWSRMSEYPELEKARLAQAVVLFAVLCWINCVAIEKWEAGRAAPGDPRLNAAHPSTQWAGAHLKSIICAIALFSIAGAWFGGTSGLDEVYLAALLSSGLFLALDARRPFLSPLSLRIAADAALLTPLAIFSILKFPAVK